MDESILESIKASLGINAEDTAFDQELISHINGSLMIANQLGVGPDDGFRITSPEQTWNEILGERKDLDLVKTVVYLRTKLVFDPPQNAFLVTAIEKQIAEYDWRIANNATPLLTVIGGIADGE